MERDLWKGFLRLWIPQPIINQVTQSVLEAVAWQKGPRDSFKSRTERSILGLLASDMLFPKIPPRATLGFWGLCSVAQLCLFTEAAD